MSDSFDIADLEAWDERIRERVAGFGLDCFPQEFEVCDHNEMLGYMTYSGMPSHYPHWSYGKSFEKLKTLYEYGVSGLPYEMVINSNPSIAYLMRGNSLLLNVLTIAHVYGHNDFFKNNSTFAYTRPEHVLSSFKAQARRVRSYVEDPSIGIERVEPLLDAAHSIAYQCRRNLAVQRDERPVENSDAGNGYRVPIRPDPDLLLFIRDHNPALAEWERDLLTIIHETTQYFIPQIETKIMNEGWATFWHKRILDALDLPHEMRLEFFVRHNQVVRPTPGQLNPYHLGLCIWEHLAGDASAGPPTLDRIFSVRETDRDVAFIRRHLEEPLMRELNLFEYVPRGDAIVVTKVADHEGWRQVKETLLQAVGMNSIPVIRVIDADFLGRRTLLLRHEHDGRDLNLAAAEKTLAHVFRLWRRDVVLETVVDERKRLLGFGDAGFSDHPRDA